MLPLGLLNAAQGHPMLVELKNGETLNGHLVSCDTWMNLTLKEVVQTSPEGDKFFRLPEVYIRGNNIKYLRFLLFESSSYKLMPPSPIIHDALWKCLCPFSKRPPQWSRNTILAGPRRRTLKWHSTPRPRAYSQHDPASSRRPSLWTSNHDANLPNTSESHDGFFSPHQDVAYAAPTSSLATAYDQLKTSSREAKYRYVQSQVEHLVKTLKQKPDKIIYDALILANADAKYGHPSEAAKLLQEMEAEGIPPDSGTYHSILRVLAVHPDQLLRAHVLQLLRQRWYSLTIDGYHDVVVGLLRERQAELALQYIEEMQKSGVVVNSWLYDMLVYTLCDMGEYDEALRLMQYRLRDSSEHEKEGAHISGTVWYYLLDTASRAMHYEATLIAYNARIATNYLHPSTGICNNILACAARNGDPKLATAIFNNLAKRSGNSIQLHHYEALLEAYVNAHDVRAAISILSTMHHAGHSIGLASTRILFVHLKQSLRNTDVALESLRNLRDAQRPVTLAAINVSIEALIHHHQLPKALALCESISRYSAYPSLPSTPAPLAKSSKSTSSKPPTSPSSEKNQMVTRTPLKPDTLTFNHLIRGCNYAKDKSSATSLLDQMIALGVQPDSLTYDRLVLCCLDADEDKEGGGLDEVRKYIEQMRTKGFVMRGGTISSVVERCKREGHAQEEVFQGKKRRFDSDPRTMVEVERA
ncbi:uncharacterized protein KY384_008708 [Bacidia gigantensis]|uniref:uncharacterized protein n=1 Tax=Bacidia gigantensis TaxID=2732470 RepID=UPI001D0398A1|nr:uncharacterized protein KY384_008708 [Bacidia gigantensis]KAG8526508.1 hypothetical protein KY384_008708 [Bacidia gigantensis]